MMLVLYCPGRLVEAFGSTRRKRQLTSREEGAVHAEKLMSPGAIQAVLNTVNQEAQEAGLTRDKVKQAWRGDGGLLEWFGRCL